MFPLRLIDFFFFSQHFICREMRDICKHTHSRNRYSKLKRFCFQKSRKHNSWLAVFRFFSELNKALDIVFIQPKGAKPPQRGSTNRHEMTTQNKNAPLDRARRDWISFFFPLSKNRRGNTNCQASVEKRAWCENLDQTTEVTKSSLNRKSLWMK